MVAQRVFQPSGSGRKGAGGGQALWQPETHRMYHGRLVDEAGGVLDEVLFLSCHPYARTSPCTCEHLVT